MRTSKINEIFKKILFAETVTDLHRYTDGTGLEHVKECALENMEKYIYYKPRKNQFHNENIQIFFFNHTPC